MSSGRGRPCDILVSVVMAVYNGEKYLRSAVLSVLGQTHVKFELLIVEDGSADNSLRILEELQKKDPRIRILRNEENIGLAASLNRAVRQAKGKYIVRMDADDLCFPGRLARQIRYMERHQKIGISYCSALKFQQGKVLRELDTNDSAPEAIRATMLFFNTIYHNGVIARKEIFEAFAYRAEFDVTEDMALWIQALERYPAARTYRSLLLYRQHEGQVTYRYWKKQQEQVQALRRPALCALLGQVSQQEEIIHDIIAQREGGTPKESLQDWLFRLQRKNQLREIYPQKVFERVLLRVYLINAVHGKYPFWGALKGMLQFGFWPFFSFGMRLAAKMAAEWARLLMDAPKGRRILKQYETSKKGT